jgi:hypothetical protein
MQYREGVGTSNFTTTTGNFFQNVKNGFELITTTTSLHRNCLFSSSLLQQKKTFDVLILPMASKKITTSKIKISTTYGILPMVTKACGGVRLGSIRLGKVRLG